MSFEVTGRLHEIYEEQQKSATFKAREFVLEIQDGNFTNYAKFQLTQDKCGLVDQFRQGDEVKVHFNLSGRPFMKDGKNIYFTNLTAWKIENANGGGGQPQGRAQQGGYQQSGGGYGNAGGSRPSAPAPMAPVSADDDELPF